MRNANRREGGECCVGPGAYNEFTVWVCQESANCSREGAYRNESIDGIFLWCECTEACYCTRDRGGTIREWCGGASLSARAPRQLSMAGRYRGGS